MTKSLLEREKARIAHLSTGGHLGGTNYGQTSGEGAFSHTNPNPPKPAPDRKPGRK